MSELDALAQLTTLLAGTGVAIAGVVQLLKATVFPDAWHNGRAPMIASAALAIAAVVLAARQLGLDLGDFTTWQAILTSFLAVYGTAIGTHQTVSKAGRVMAGTTNPQGPDDAAP